MFYYQKENGVMSTEDGVLSSVLTNAVELLKSKVEANKDGEVKKIRARQIIKSIEKYLVDE